MTRVISIAFLLASGSTGLATPIVFTHSVVASGSLDGVMFPSVPVIVTAWGDTTNRTVDGYSVISLDLDSAAVTLQGIGTFNFELPLREFFNPASIEFGKAGLPVVGLSRGPSVGLDLLDGPSSADLSNWTMTTSIGPITGFGSISQWDTIARSFTVTVPTSGGALVLNDALTLVTFKATIVPEPTTATLLLLGMLGCGWRRH